MSETTTRRAPVQSQERRGKWAKPSGTVAWWEHEKAWEPYGARYSQSAERIAALIAGAGLLQESA